ISKESACRASLQIITFILCYGIWFVPMENRSKPGSKRSVGTDLLRQAYGVVRQRNSRRIVQHLPMPTTFGVHFFSENGVILVLADTRFRFLEQPGLWHLR